ncbi:MAG: putative manganese transporter [Candidatus Omnitrophota bacterium]|nr:putative manganese transporter [Candidatus Omnitrophota bacterium]
MYLLKDAFTDTMRLLPLLAAVYFFVSFLEYRYGDRMGSFLAHFHKFGPVAGAIFGCMPQCGFSVMASALYVKRVISVGTLLAVFLSTSDEAVPILLSMPSAAHMVGILIIIKVAIAISAGMAVDLLLHSMKASKLKKAASIDVICEDAIMGHSGCCSHGVDKERSKIRSLFIHPLRHTVKIFVFLFVLSAALNYSVYLIGENRIEGLLLNGTVFQPFLTAMIGLIPNCFASVLLAGLFAKGAISFGSMVAGLSTGAGLGMLVLIKENKDLKDTLSIIGLLIAISVFAGVVIQIISGR